MNRLPRLLATVTAALVIQTAYAQTPPPGADGAIQATNSIVQLIDQKKSADVWDGAAAAAKAVVPRDTFVSRIDEARKALGELKSRTWTTVKRQTVPAGAQIPAGRYVSVEYDSVFGANRPAQELVTFRLDEDGIWRFMGYALQPVVPPAAVPAPAAKP